jgi:hypothetical protein
MGSQGASGGPSQGAGNKQFVKFSRGAAQRIAKVVRTVEQGNRDQPGITFLHPMPLGGKVFRVCTFTGAWSKASDKTVTLRNQTATLVATNLFANITAAGSSRACAIAKDGTAWYLIAAEC